MFYIVNTNEPENFEEARDELWKVIFHPSLEANFIGIVFNLDKSDGIDYYDKGELDMIFRI